MNVEFLKDVALAVAQEQHLETVMKMIVEGISQEPDVALVRLCSSRQGISAQNVIYGPSAQTKLVACIWSLVLDTRWTNMKIGPGSMAPSDEFRSVSANSGSLANRVNPF
jgi:hypothetical protein